MMFTPIEFVRQRAAMIDQWGRSDPDLVFENTKFLADVTGLNIDDLASDECPFDPPPPRAEILRGPRWVRPELVAELEFGEWTHDDRLRHPSYLGMRTDKSPEEVTRDA